jgi:hypothetical protein
VYDQTRAAFRETCGRAKAILEEASGRRVIGYRAPSYSITPRSQWALDILIEEGYAYDSSIFRFATIGMAFPVSIEDPIESIEPASAIIEVPASTTRLGR